MPPVPIGTIDDPRVADFRDIRDADLLTRRDLFVAEGRLVVRRLLESARLDARAVLVTDTALATIEDLLPARPALPVYVAPQGVMNAIAGFDIHRGCLALGRRPVAQAWATLVAKARRLVVLERVGNADNVGSVFRNAAAFGVDAVLLGPACANPLYRKAIRTSMGTTLALPFAEASPWPGVLGDLRDSGWSVVALTPDQAAPPMRSVLPDPAAPPGKNQARPGASGRVALVLGHEGEGLSAAALDACSARTRIPMRAGVDSLNVATAAAIALYELACDAIDERIG